MRTAVCSTVALFTAGVAGVVLIDVPAPGSAPPTTPGTAMLAAVEAHETAIGRVEDARVARAEASAAAAAAAEHERSQALARQRARAARAARTAAAPRPQPAPASPAPVPPDARGPAFWRALANCECASGRCDGFYISYFQFDPGTAAKVGIDGSEPYEEQVAAAQEWARRIHPRENTRSGWPECWDQALAHAG